MKKLMICLPSNTRCTTCLLVFIFSIAGCASNQALHKKSLDKPYSDTPAPPLNEKVLAASDDKKSNVENRIRAEYERWKNTPHKLGGNDLDGVDCSGLVRQIYKDLFQLQIDRTTKEQIKKGVPVKRTELKAGDLVFFNLPSFPRHVGIYLGSGEFMHASSSKGVITSRLDRGYWSKRYRTARRLYNLL